MAFDWDSYSAKSVAGFSVDFAQKRSSEKVGASLLF